MSSHQAPYHHTSSPPIHCGGGSGHLVVRRSHSPSPSWVPGIATGDQAGYYSQSHSSVDRVGTLLAAHESQDMNYPLDNLHSPQGTSFPGPGSATDATPNDNTDNRFDFPTSSFVPFSDIDYRYPQYQSSYAAYEQSHDLSGQPVAYPMNYFPFSGYYPQEFLAPQTSEPPLTPVYPSSSSSSPPQLPFSAHGVPVYGTDTGPERPTPGSVTHGVSTTNMGLPAGWHSHPSPVATSNQNFAAGPSHQAPSSPERKRLLPSSTDEERSSGATARRVLPRSNIASSVHSVSSDSHRGHRHLAVRQRGPMIPQDRYTTSSISIFNTPDQHPSISFELENPHEIGVPIIDILDKTGSFARIRDPTQEFSHKGKKTFTLRVQWPGYKSWSKTIAALNWKKNRAPITRVKLAEAVATAIRDLVERKRDERFDPQYAAWNLAPGGIRLEQLCLVSLFHVSTGSWQPQLCLLEPR